MCFLVCVCALQLCVLAAEEFFTVQRRLSVQEREGVWKHSCGRACKRSTLTSIVNTWLVFKRKIWYIFSFLQVLINYMSCFVGAVMYTMGLRCSAVQGRLSGYCIVSKVASKDVFIIYIPNSESGHLFKFPQIYKLSLIENFLCISVSLLARMSSFFQWLYPRLDVIVLRLTVVINLAVTSRGRFVFGLGSSFRFRAL